MLDVLLVGNPNVGKSTLFNSLTKSHEHTGNFHGVTVDATSKVVKLANEEYRFFDLPGIYSLNTYSPEEENAKAQIISTKGKIIVLLDANNLRKNLYLCMQLDELNINYQIFINNYDYFIKRGNKLNINILQNKLNKQIKIINAKKIKLDKTLINKQTTNNLQFDKEINNKYLAKIIEKIKNELKIDKKTIINAINGQFFALSDGEKQKIDSYQEQIVQARYDYIDEILSACLTTSKNYIYGANKIDKVLLNPFLMSVGFTLFFGLSLYIIFFSLGKELGNLINTFICLYLQEPIMTFVCSVTDNLWLIEFFSGGVFGSISTILSFLPQVCLLFAFLTILEDSGVIARMCYVFDDLLTKFGLNGKALYIILLGLGCNTMATMTTKNLSNQNLKIKSAILNPYISCVARLPIFVLIASAFFSNSFWVVFGLYLLGLIIMFVMSTILNKTFLKTENGEMLMEFPPLRHIDLKHIGQVVYKNALDFTKRIFSVIMTMGIIVWILTHTTFKLSFTQDISQSCIYFLTSKIAFLFAPIGLDNAGIITALIVGVLAKELVVSTMAICNRATTNTMLIQSLTNPLSLICLSPSNAVSLLIFTLLYCPCVSTLSILRQETDKFYMYFALVSQFVVAYMLAFVAYQFMQNGVLITFYICLAIVIIYISLILIFKQLKHKKCFGCIKNCYR